MGVCFEKSGAGPLLSKKIEEKGRMDFRRKKD